MSKCSRRNSRRLHLLRATAILSLVVLLQSCLVRRPTVTDMPHMVGAYVRVRSGESFQLLPGRGAAESTPLWMVNSVEGRIVRVVADTIMLDRGADPVGIPVAAGKERDLVKFVPPQAAEIAVNQKRVALITLSVVVVGTLALLIYLERALNDFEF